MRVFKNRWFARFARKERIPDTDLCEAIILLKLSNRKLDQLIAKQELVEIDCHA